MSGLTYLFDTAQQWLFETLVQPALFMLGQANVLEDGYAATGWLLVGLLQLGVMVAVIGPLERWRPVEPLRASRRRPGIRLRLRLISLTVSRWWPPALPLPSC